MFIRRDGKNVYSTIKKTKHPDTNSAVDIRGIYGIKNNQNRYPKMIWKKFL